MARGGKYFTEGTSTQAATGSRMWAGLGTTAEERRNPPEQKRPNQLGIYDMSGNVGVVRRLVWRHRLLRKWQESGHCCRPTGPCYGHVPRDPRRLVQRGAELPRRLSQPPRRAVGTATLASALLCPCRQMGAPLRLSCEQKGKTKFTWQSPFKFSYNKNHV
ncbi:MAG: hypothetical protein IPK76_17645 [Lewinellaceae bacterium]|nr:hypothetical protein [Lewinellaceae bacterium]